MAEFDYFSKLKMHFFQIKYVFWEAHFQGVTLCVCVCACGSSVNTCGVLDCDILRAPDAGEQPMDTNPFESCR